MLKKDLDDLNTNGEVGDWAFLDNDKQIAFRYGHEAFTGTVVIPIFGPHGWIWNGNRREPTIEPSILVRPYEGWTEGWHGWLRDGKLVTA
jgi:hypothetical protein